MYFVNIKYTFGLRLTILYLCFPLLLLFSNWEALYHVRCCLLVGLVHCAWDPLPFLKQNFHWNCTVQWVPCTIHGLTNFFSYKTFIKNETHGIIHTFKNYFTTVFSIFSKISGIQADSKYILVSIFIIY